MEKIIVPTDFSLNAGKALEFAVQIAKQAKSEIILIHACELIESVFKDTQALYKENNKLISDKAMESLLFSKPVAMHVQYKEGEDKLPKNAF